MLVRAKVCLFLAACCCLNICSIAHAKSVYAISRHSDSTVKAFDIQDTGLELQYTGRFPNNGSGAIDLTVNDRDDIIFVSYDGVNILEAISTKTMEPVATETISGGTENEIAGLEYCHAYNLLLAAERYDASIRVLEYDPISKVFTKNVEVAMPDVDSGGILGLCLDEQEMRLYVSMSYEDTVVKYYDFDVQGDEISVTYQGDIPIEWDGDKIAVGIALYNNGAGTKYLYSSGYNHENPQEHPYVIRTSLTASNEVIDRLGVKIDPCTYVAGMDTDDETGYLYLTTLVGISSIRVYDPNQWTDDPNDCQYVQMFTDPDTSGPAGIAVGPNFFSPNQLFINKKQISPDPNTCVNPDTMVTYRTAFHQDQAEESNVVLREFLPEESIFVSADPNTGYYDSLAHTYSWDVGHLPALEPNGISDPNRYYEITIYVTNTAEPGGYIVNMAEVESDSSYAKDNVRTSICCWTLDGHIYVNHEATGHNSGVNWENAYRDLNDALNRSAGGCGSEVWVAEGVYSPGNSTSDTYQIPDNVEVYGGFEGTETSRDQRNWMAHQTILSGYIDEDSFGNSVQSETVVTMGNNTLLDGFMIQAGEYQGILGKNSDFTVRNCDLVDNEQIGIYSENGDLTVEWCEVANSGFQGLYHVGNSGTRAIIKNCRIYNNLKDGIYTSNSNLHIINSLIYQNGLAGDSDNPYYGVDLLNSHPDLLLCNNTIVSNMNGGVHAVGGNLPQILNCIIWNNADKQLAGFNADSAAFNSCIQDCNDINFNISVDPGFAYGKLSLGNTNYHLAYDSPCIDAGDGVTDVNDFDIDGQTRVYGDFVDIGADEAVSCDGVLTADDIYDSQDRNADGFVNYADFPRFSEAWLCHDPNDPSLTTDPNRIGDPNYVDPATISQWQLCWDPTCNLDNTSTSAYEIDMADLEFFWDEHWFWIACWKENEIFDW